MKTIQVFVLTLFFLTLMVQGAGALDLGNYTVSSIGYSMQSCDQTLVDTNNDDTFNFRFFDPEKEFEPIVKKTMFTTDVEYKSGQHAIMYSPAPLRYHDGTDWVETLPRVEHVNGSWVIYTKIDPDTYMEVLAVEGNSVLLRANVSAKNNKKAVAFEGKTNGSLTMDAGKDYVFWEEVGKDRRLKFGDNSTVLYVYTNTSAVLDGEIYDQDGSKTTSTTGTTAYVGMWKRVYDYNCTTDEFFGEHCEEVHNADISDFINPQFTNNGDGTWNVTLEFNDTVKSEILDILNDKDKREKLAEKYLNDKSKEKQIADIQKIPIKINGKKSTFEGLGNDKTLTVQEGSLEFGFGTQVWNTITECTFNSTRCTSGPSGNACYFKDDIVKPNCVVHVENGIELHLTNVTVEIQSTGHYAPTFNIDPGATLNANQTCTFTKNTTYYGKYNFQGISNVNDSYFPSATYLDCELDATCILHNVTLTAWNCQNTADCYVYDSTHGTSSMSITEQGHAYLYNYNSTQTSSPSSSTRLDAVDSHFGYLDPTLIAADNVTTIADLYWGESFPTTTLINRTGDDWFLNLTRVTISNLRPANSVTGNVTFVNLTKALSTYYQAGYATFINSTYASPSSAMENGKTTFYNSNIQSTVTLYNTHSFYFEKSVYGDNTLTLSYLNPTSGGTPLITGYVDVMGSTAGIWHTDNLLTRRFPFNVTHGDGSPFSGANISVYYGTTLLNYNQTDGNGFMELSFVFNQTNYTYPLEVYYANESMWLLNMTFASDTQEGLRATILSDIPYYTVATNGTNTTIAGAYTNFYETWNDDVNLRGSIMEYCNGTYNGTDCEQYANLSASVSYNNTYGFETSWLPDTNWTTGVGSGVTNVWFQSSNQSATGTYSAQSGITADSARTAMNVTHTWDTAGYMQVKMNVSSELSWDYCCICSDIQPGATGCTCDSTGGTVTYRSSGINVSTPNIYMTAGTHQIFFIYEKDGSGTGGKDWCSVDDIQFVHNTTGSSMIGGWTNTSFRSDSGLTATINHSIYTNATVGARMAYRFYVNDSTNQWNSSGVYSYYTTEGGADTTKPDLHYVYPTLANNSFTANYSWIYINVTGTEDLSSFTPFFDNGTVNTTLSVSGTNVYLNVTGLANNTQLDFMAWASDASGNWNHTEWRRITVNLTSYYPCVPSIVNTTPAAYANTSCNATDQLINWTWWVQWDANECGAFSNITWYRNETLPCDYCQYNVTNTSTTYEGNTTHINHANISCNASDILTLNWSWTEWSWWVQFDTNYSTCYAITNLPTDNFTNVTWYDNASWYNYTYEACEYCTPSLANGTWTYEGFLPPVNENNISCNSSDILTLNWTNEYWNWTALLDFNGCDGYQNDTIYYANGTVYNYTYEACDFCTPSLTNTTQSAYQNTTCNSSDQLVNWSWWVQWDTNVCGGFTNITWYDNHTMACDFCTPSMSNTTPVTTLEACNLSNQQLNWTVWTEWDTNVCGEVGNTTWYHNETLACDGVAPLISFVSPTDNNASVRRTYSYVNVSLSETGTCLLEWNGVNQSMTVVGNTTYANKTNLDYNGNYTFRAWCNDSYGNLRVSNSRWVFIVDTANITIQFNASQLSHIAYISLPRRANLTAASGNGMPYNWATWNVTHPASQADTWAGANPEYGIDGDNTTYTPVWGSGDIYTAALNFSEGYNLNGNNIIAFLLMNNNFTFYNLPTDCINDSSTEKAILGAWIAGISQLRCYNYSSSSLLALGPFITGMQERVYEVGYYLPYNFTSRPVTIDIGNNEDTDYTFYAANESEAIDFNVTAINDYLHDTCTADWATGYCEVPINISSVSPGWFRVFDLGLTYTNLSTFGSCGGSYLGNITFYFYNEEGFAAMNGSSYYAITDTTTEDTWNGTASNVESFTICIINSTYVFDAIIEYWATSYGTRFYLLDGTSVSGSEDVSLYLLNESLGDYVDISNTDAIGFPLTDAIVHYQRYFIELDQYRTVAMSKSDDKGTTTVFLKTDNTWYKYVLMKDGVILRIIGPSLISGTSATISDSAGDTLSFSDYDNGIGHTCDYDDVTGYITCDVADTTGMTAEVCLTTYTTGIFNMTRQAVQCSSGPSFALLLNVSNVTSLNNTIRYQLVTEEGYVLEEGFTTVGASTPYGLVGVLIAAMLVTFLATMFASNPAVVIFMGVIGICISAAFALLYVPELALGSIIVVAIILIIKVKT